MAAGIHPIASLRGVSRSYGPRPVLDRLDLDIAEGEFVAMIGHSGSGKSTLLRILAGLDQEVTGSVEVRGPVSVAFQEPRLVPWKRVLANVSLGLRAPSPDEAARDALAEVGLTELASAWPLTLSGGEAQRASLARALVRSPALLLLDEPFSALDAPVRAQLYRELRRLQREVGMTTVLVTHDPEEAALLADDVVVLAEGHVLQQGAVSEVFAHPASPRVAALLGIPNTHAGTVIEPGRVLSGGLEIGAPTGTLDPGSAVHWTVRPEDVAVDGRGPYRATVLDTVPLGAIWEITLQLGALRLVARRAEPPHLDLGSECRADIPLHAMTLWPADG